MQAPATPSIVFHVEGYNTPAPAALPPPMDSTGTGSAGGVSCAGVLSWAPLAVVFAISLIEVLMASTLLTAQGSLPFCRSHPCVAGGSICIVAAVITLILCIIRLVRSCGGQLNADRRRSVWLFAPASGMWMVTTLTLFAVLGWPLWSATIVCNMEIVSASLILNCLCIVIFDAYKNRTLRTAENLPDDTIPLRPVAVPVDPTAGDVRW